MLLHQINNKLFCHINKQKEQHKELDFENLYLKELIKFDVSNSKSKSDILIFIDLFFSHI
jgi:hypothetical protein